MSVKEKKSTGGSIRELHSSFWVANTMEIFERMAWYGFYAVSSLYITGSTESGGLGLTNEDRGVLQGVVTFFLYLFPVVTGAIADRYGFRRTLLVAYILLTPAYYLLGQFHSFWGCFAVFMFVAVGAAVFKPVVIATVARATNEKTRPVGFGIFYMMVNVGGFLGPIVAGVVRGWGWKYVFIMSSVWISVNFLLLLFYKEPPGADDAKRSFKDVMTGMVEVLGNGRFFFTVFGVLLALVLGSKWLSWGVVGIITGGWLVLNLVWDAVCRTSFKGRKGWLSEPMRVGDWRFVLFLLLMSGFYSAFNQLFITLPLYIRDFTETGPIFDFVVSIATTVGIDNAREVLAPYMVSDQGVFRPEYLININAGCIILFQVLISIAFQKRRPFLTILFGLGLVAASFTMFMFGTVGWIVAGGIAVFSFGEMMASPKAKEYVGRIAPPERVGLYMGYFFWCMALGNLISATLSGQLYGVLTEDLQRPDIMWGIFAALALVTGVFVILYDRIVVPKEKAN